MNVGSQVVMTVDRENDYYKICHNCQEHTLLLHLYGCTAAPQRMISADSTSAAVKQPLRISRSCCERNLITCLPHLNNNEFFLQTNPLWNFNYGVKAVICPHRDRAVSVESGKRSAEISWRIPTTLNSSLWFLPHHWLWIYSSKCPKKIFINVFVMCFIAARGSGASKKNL